MIWYLDIFLVYFEPALNSNFTQDLMFQPQWLCILQWCGTKMSWLLLLSHLFNLRSSPVQILFVPCPKFLWWESPKWFLLEMMFNALSSVYHFYHFAGTIYHDRQCSLSKIYFFYLQVGYPNTNFGLLTRKRPPLPDVNCCIISISARSSSEEAHQSHAGRMNGI